MFLVSLYILSVTFIALDNLELDCLMDCSWPGTKVIKRNPPKEMCAFSSPSIGCLGKVLSA